MVESAAWGGLALLGDLPGHKNKLLALHRLFSSLDRLRLGDHRPGHVEEVARMLSIL